MYLSAVCLVPVTFLLSSLGAKLQVCRRDLLGPFPDNVVEAQDSVLA